MYLVLLYRNAFLSPKVDDFKLQNTILCSCMYEYALIYKGIMHIFLTDFAHVFTYKIKNGGKPICDLGIS